VINKRFLEIAIPGRKGLHIENLLFDLNGTLALDGHLLEGVEERLSQLKESFNVYIMTSDTHGTAERLKGRLDIHFVPMEKGYGMVQKLDFLRHIGNETTAAIGNGSNDILMLKDAAIGICVIGREGASWEAMINSDMIVWDINDALEMFLNPKRVIATLRR
jgi:P-type E1-E2 ATPase